MKAAEVKELTDEELAVKLEELGKEFLNLRFQNATQQLEKSHQLKAVRRDIARIKTVMNQRKKGQNVEASQ